ncbi:hypothetical protein AKJ09_04675 [Labilithrix luteola]|uniref:Globin domain-containing protein n=1 Tax=Labilithrix luteola TaxID=1391654 RepID=A0A0K1PX98_9BACT|nr:globin [Labilithrix luteola]AKU98011.1 hypothetical protein AKJ09_04675 [Labilithrix luteola]
MPFDAVVLKESWHLSYRRAPDLAARFYEELSWKYPSARRLLDHVFGAQNDIAVCLSTVAGDLLDNVDDPDAFSAAIVALANAHVSLDIPPHVVAWMEEVLLDTLEGAAGDDWTPEMRTTWRNAYEDLASRLARARAHS